MNWRTRHTMAAKTNVAPEPWPTDRLRHWLMIRFILVFVFKQPLGHRCIASLNSARAVHVTYVPDFVCSITHRSGLGQNSCGTRWMPGKQPTHSRLTLVTWTSWWLGYSGVCVLTFSWIVSHSRWWDESCLCISETLLDCCKIVIVINKLSKYCMEVCPDWLPC